MEDVIFKIESNREETGIHMCCSAEFAVQTVSLAMADLANKIYNTGGEKECMYFIEQLEKAFSGKRIWDCMERIGGAKRKTIFHRIKDLFK